MRFKTTLLSVAYLRERAGTGVNGSHGFRWRCGVPVGSEYHALNTDADIAEDFNLGGRGHKSLLKESGVSIRGR